MPGAVVCLVAWVETLFYGGVLTCADAPARTILQDMPAILFPQGGMLCLQCLPRQDREVVRVRIADANSGGLLTTCESLPAFIPYSHVPKSAKMSANVRLNYSGSVHVSNSRPAVGTRVCSPRLTSTCTFRKTPVASCP